MDMTPEQEAAFQRLLTLETLARTAKDYERERLYEEWKQLRAIIDG